MVRQMGLIGRPGTLGPISIPIRCFITKLDELEGVVSGNSQKRSLAGVDRLYD